MYDQLPLFLSLKHFVSWRHDLLGASIQYPYCYIFSVWLYLGGYNSNSFFGVEIRVKCIEVVKKCIFRRKSIFLTKVPVEVRIPVKNLKNCKKLIKAIIKMFVDC